VFREIALKNVDMSQFETTQVFYTSRDKASAAECQVPMFIVHRKVTAAFILHTRSDIAFYVYARLHFTVLIPFVTIAFCQLF